MEVVSSSTFKEIEDLYHNLKKSHNEKLAEQGLELGELSNNNNAEDEHFVTLLDRLETILQNLFTTDPHYMKVLSMKSSLLYEQAKIFIALEDLDSSQSLLEKALAVIEEHRNHPQITFLYMRLINHLAYLLSRRGIFDRSRELLESILDGNEPKHDIIVYSTEELFSCQEIDQSQVVSKINKLVANNLQMLGWIYGRLGKSHLHATKQHLALDRQLQAGDKDPIGWASRCSRLALLDLHNCAWATARYHLLAAGVVLDRLEREFIQDPELARAQADLARGWINYGLHLFTNSKAHFAERLYPGIFTEEPVAQGGNPDDGACPKFYGMEVASDGIPVKPIQTTEQARRLFLHTHTWLKRARLYYTLRDFPIHYVNAVLDLSELYRFLAFFEPDLDSQYNVQKKRADALETLSAVLKEVRPQCYIAVSVELLRELAETQIEMMGINLRRLHVTGDAVGDDEETLKRKISAISEIQLKLDGVGDMLGHSGLDDREIEQGVNSVPNQACVSVDECIPEDAAL